MFLPGELTQSLCSPWTHDFRDVGVFLASNHPDIALLCCPLRRRLPPEINTYAVGAQGSNGEHSARSGDHRYAGRVSHYEINNRWQTLNFVLEGGDGCSVPARKIHRPEVCQPRRTRHQSAIRGGR